MSPDLDILCVVFSQGTNSSDVLLNFEQTTNLAWAWQLALLLRRQKGKEVKHADTSNLLLTGSNDNRANVMIYL